MGRIVALLLLLFAIPTHAGATDLSGYIAEAEQVLQRLRSAMMEEMQKAMQIGPKEAIGVCRHLAPQIEAKIGAETGWKIRRTALRVRNPDNAADPTERGILLGYEARALSGQDPTLLRTAQVVDVDGRTTVHFMQAVPMFDTCLACHGTNVAPDVMAEIKKLYPRDRAVGYSVGDIRGAFSLSKPFDPSAAVQKRDVGRDWAAIAALTLPQSVPLNGIGKTGNAARGRDLFKRHCYGCHAPDDLVGYVAVARPTTDDPLLCEVLKTHGLTDAVGDCDVAAFLKTIADLRQKR